ncbi:unnamed protein product, partial [Rotaria magnacalcarata]
ITLDIGELLSRFES